VTVPPVHVQLLYWEGCPSYPQALSDLRAAMAELGLDPARVEVRDVSSDARAAEERFVGSPTIRIDGTDAVDPGMTGIENASPAVGCTIEWKP
jgi:hypothetical protein